MKKIIKYNWSCWYDDFKKEDLDYMFVDLFKNDKDYDLVFSDDPDYVFYGPYHDFLTQAEIDNFDTVKIFYGVEPISPNFMIFDYCIGFEPGTFGDRYAFFPFMFFTMKEKYPRLKIEEATKIFLKKDLFCDFIYRHNGHDISREHYFKLLSQYKRVEAAGNFLNNQNENINVSYMDGTKVAFQSRCKFSFCIQSTDVDWFFNEEIIDSFNAYSIPIFYGSSKIKEIFNPKRFIFIGDYETDEELLNKIIEIDQNDELYCQIISEPVFVNENFKVECKQKLKKFFINIFEKENPKVLRNCHKVGEIRNRIIRNNQKTKKIDKLKSKIMFWKK